MRSCAAGGAGSRRRSRRAGRCPPRGRGTTKSCCMPWLASGGEAHRACWRGGPWVSRQCPLEVGDRAADLDRWGTVVGQLDSGRGQDVHHRRARAARQLVQRARELGGLLIAAHLVFQQPIARHRCRTALVRSLGRRPRRWVMVARVTSTLRRHLDARPAESGLRPAPCRVRIPPHGWRRTVAGADRRSRPRGAGSGLRSSGLLTQERMKSRRSALIVAASVVGMPWGKPE